MLLGIVDLGTLSVRFDVFDTNSALPVPVLRYRKMLRLGERLFGEGKIDPEAEERTVTALREIAGIAAQHTLSRIVAVATSALREANNGAAVLERIRAETGIAVQTITGEEEARLTALGILTFEQLAHEPLVLLDIGGGSTEVSIHRSGAPLLSVSFATGAGRLYDSYFNRCGDDAAAKHAAAAAARAATRLLLAELDEVRPDNYQAVGSSGTVRALGRMLTEGGDEHRMRVTALDIGSVIDQLITERRHELLARQGVEESRLDYLLPGAIILDETLRALHLADILVTVYSLRHGVLAETLETAKSL